LHPARSLPITAILVASSLVTGCYVPPVPPPRVVAAPPPLAPPAGPEVLVTVQPPPPRYEVRPPAPGGLVEWDPGHWRWNGVTHVWVGGHYVRRPTPYAVWVPGRWVNRPGGWAWMEGHWRA
jgi:hypothetical protein